MADTPQTQASTTPPAPPQKVAPEEEKGLEPLFRTYARDLAAASGKPLPASSAATKKTLQDAIADDAAKVPEMPEAKRDTWSPPPPPSGRNPADILAKLRGKAGGGALQKERPQTVVSLDDARGDILERLKAKAKIPDFKLPEMPRAAPPSPPAPTFAPPPAPPIPLAKRPEGPERLHTFKSDFSDRIDDKQASTLSVLAAEQDRGTRRSAPVKKSGNPFAFVAGLVLVLAGALGVYFAFRFATDTPPLPIITTVPSIIFADDYVPVYGEGKELLAAIASVAATPIPDGNLVVTYVVEATTTPEGPFENPLPGGALIERLALPAPEVLFRNIAEISTVGVVHANNETRAFFILRVTSFERTFSGMLQWEGTMADDLALLYPEYAPEALQLPEPIETATSTATTSPATTTTTTPLTLTATSSVPLTLQLGPDDFVDEVVQNHDVRILYDETGRSIMLYGYKDKQTLIIARDKEAFAEILNRLSSTRTN